MNRKALLIEWDREQRRGGFYLLLFLQTLLPLMLLAFRRVIGGDASLTAYLQVFRRLWMITLPLTGLWGWNRRSDTRGIHSLLELPLSLRDLVLMMGRFQLRALFLFLFTPGLILIFGQLQRFEPLVLLLSLASLLLEGIGILGLSTALMLRLESRVPALLSSYLLLLLYSLLIPLSPWGLDSHFEGYFKGSAFALHLLIAGLMPLLWAMTLRRKRRI